MIVLKTKAEVDKIRQGGKILASILDKIIAEVKPGAETGQLEEMARMLIRNAGGRPSFKGYASGKNHNAFPTALCTSINDEVVHSPALPSRILKNGDIIGIDVGMEYPFKRGEIGYFTDMAVTAGVGKISGEAQKLLRVTKESLDLAIKSARPGGNLNDIAGAVQRHAEKNGFSVVRDLVGHGVGKDVHEEPQVPNFIVPKNNDIILKTGLVIAIEPMVNAGAPDIKSGEDGFTVMTADGSLSAHFEHTVAVTEEGVEVLTKL